MQCCSTPPVSCPASCLLPLGSLLVPYAKHICPACPGAPQITVTKTYNITNLFEDIKALYKIAGFKGQSVCFLFTDAEVKDEGFLEYINQILMTGVRPQPRHSACRPEPPQARLSADSPSCRFQPLSAGRECQPLFAEARDMVPAACAWRACCMLACPCMRGLTRARGVRVLLSPLPAQARWRGCCPRTS